MRFVEHAGNDLVGQSLALGGRRVVVGSDLDVFQGLDQTVVEVLIVDGVASAALGSALLILFPLFKENLEQSDALILYDVLLGLDATVIIRKKDKELPIIMQTAYAFTADREKALECGASEVLVKPITLSALRTCLSRYLPKLVW